MSDIFDKERKAEKIFVQKMEIILSLRCANETKRKKQKSTLTFFVESLIKLRPETKVFYFLKKCFFIAAVKNAQHASHVVESEPFGDSNVFFR